MPWFLNSQLTLEKTTAAVGPPHTLRETETNRIYEIYGGRTYLIEHMCATQTTMKSRRTAAEPDARCVII